MPSRRGRSEDDFNEEIEAHIALETDRLVREGSSPDEAAAAARRRFGSVASAQERFYESRRLMWLDDARRDIRYALRMLVRDPTFTAVAVLTLALGMGANTAIFSVVNAVLVRSLPYRDADRFVRIVEDTDPGPERSSASRVAGIHKIELDVLRSQARSLSHVGTYVPATMTMSGRGEAVRLNGIRLSPSVLSMLGEQPLLGRLFEAREESAGQDAVVVLSYACWQRQFDASPEIIGQVISLDGIGYSVVGVMPAGFQFPDPEAQFWIPFVWPMQARLIVTARVADGRSLQAANEEVGTILRQLRQDDRIRRLAAPPPPPPPPPALGVPATPSPALAPPPPRPGAEATPPGRGSGPRFRLLPLHDQVVAPVKRALLLLTAAVALVLLIACANVGNLLVARAASRQGEMAVRVALGAGRVRLIRQALTESAVVAIAGGALGTVLAFGGVKLLRELGTTLPRQTFALSFGVPRLNEVAVDGSALLFTLVVSSISGIAFGLMPALWQSRSNPADPLREQSSSALSGFDLLRRHRVRGMLIVAEIGMALLLFLGAGLLIRSFIKLSNVDPGFDSAGVLTFRVALPPGRSMVTFREELAARLASLSGARAIGYADQLPMGPIRGVMQLRASADQPRVPPPPPAPGGSRHPEFPDLRLVSHDFVRVMGMRLVAGRGFDEGDGAGRPQVVLINRALAQSGFLGPNPIGRRIFSYGPSPWEIVGIVEDVRQLGLDVEPGPQVFVDFRQFPPANASSWSPPYFAVRADGDPTALIPNLRALVRQLDSRASVDTVATLDQILSSSMVRPRMYAVLLGIFAAVAVMLAMVGIYGVVAYAVARRTREIGVRMALGATTGDVMQLVLRQSLPLVGLGLTLGLAGAGALTRTLEGLLFGLTPTDPATFIGATLAFAMVATLAATVPARRATKVDPLVALRLE